MPIGTLTPQTVDTLLSVPDIQTAVNTATGSNFGNSEGGNLSALAGAVNPWGGLINQAGTFLLGQTQAVAPLTPTAPQRSSAYGPVYIAAGVGLVVLVILAFVILKK